MGTKSTESGAGVTALRTCASCVFAAASGGDGRRRCCHPGAMFPGQFLTGPAACSGYRPRPTNRARTRRPVRAEAARKGNFALVHSLVS